jgi:YHS domain-containing protein
MKQLRVCVILAGLVGAMISTIAQAGDDRLALKGYDPVAYFTEKRAMLGSPEYRYDWDGAIYHFASAKHLELFKADPDHYLPQYNTWCAASVAKGVKVYGNPEWWLIVDDRLYLFGQPVGPERMKKDAANMKAEADRNWPAVSKLPAPPLPDYMRAVGQTSAPTIRQP